MCELARRGLPLCVFQFSQNSTNDLWRLADGILFILGRPIKDNV